MEGSLHVQVKPARLHFRGFYEGWHVDLIAHTTSVCSPIVLMYTHV